MSVSIKKARNTHKIKLKYSLANYGSKNPNAKLNEANIVHIRKYTKQFYESKHVDKSLLVDKLCKIYNISRPSIYSILQNKSWKHIMYPILQQHLA